MRLKKRYIFLIIILSPLFYYFGNQLIAKLYNIKYPLLNEQITARDYTIELVFKSKYLSQVTKGGGYFNKNDVSYVMLDTLNEQFVFAANGFQDKTNQKKLMDLSKSKFSDIYPLTDVIVSRNGTVILSQVNPQKNFRDSIRKHAVAIHPLRDYFENTSKQLINKVFESKNKLHLNSLNPLQVFALHPTGSKTTRTWSGHQYLKVWINNRYVYFRTATNNTNIKLYLITYSNNERQTLMCLEGSVYIIKPVRDRDRIALCE
ncbi:hypothetical protein [Tenacibaculum larymnensis]|uniref:Uncharacterized protein n=1 Tax=Tenacibaculum larymnensis TaxID=2878201 RepID=A0A9X4EQZ3_9FLAO|nr:hypothetical protein [Tenacibaculum larymnensis]MDE1207674.1 hypothetical protein [Tenacibaculum larymnensis]